MYRRVYKTELRHVFKQGMVAASILGIALLVSLTVSMADSDFMRQLMIKTSGALFFLGAILLLRWFWGLFTAVHVGDTGIAVHGLLRRPIHIHYDNAVMFEKRITERLRCIEIQEKTGPLKRRKKIVLSSTLDDFDNLALFLKAHVVMQGEEMVQQTTLVESFSDGIAIKVNASVPFVFSLFGILAIYFSVFWMRQPGEMDSYSNMAMAAGAFVLGAASLVSAIALYRTFHFDPYGVSKTTFLYRVHIPWDKIVSCGWTENKKRILIRSKTAVINCKDATARSRALLEFLTTCFPALEENDNVCAHPTKDTLPLQFPFTIKLSLEFRIVISFPLLFALGMFIYSFQELSTFPILWTPGLILRIVFIVGILSFFCFFLATVPLRYVFDNEFISTEKLFGGKHYRVAELRAIHLDQSRQIQGEPVNFLAIFFETGKIVLNTSTISFPLEFLHTELQRLYFGKNVTPILPSVAANNAAALPFPRKSPSPWPHGTSIHWRGLGTLAVYWTVPVALIGLGWLVLHGNALNRAVDAGDISRIETLLDEGANPNRGNLFGWTPMHSADTPEILRLLLEHGGDVNVESRTGAGPLLMACRRGVDKETIALMIAAGADVNHNAHSFVYGYPILAAAFHGNADTIFLLLDAGARIEERGNSGTTPLIEAAAGGNADTTRALLQRGAEVNACVTSGKNSNNEIHGGTALHYAARENAPDVVNALLESGATIEAVTEEGWTPLHIAYGMDAGETIALLIGKGALSTAKDRHGYTPEMLKGKKMTPKRER